MLIKSNTPSANQVELTIRINRILFAGLAVSNFGLGWFMRDATTGVKIPAANTAMAFVIPIATCIQWSLVIYLWLRSSKAPTSSSTNQT